MITKLSVMMMKMTAPTEPPNRTKRMTMKLPSIQPDLVAAPQHPRQVNRARKPVITSAININMKYVALVGSLLSKDGSIFCPMKVYSPYNNT